MAASSASDSGLTANEVSLWFPEAEQKLRLMKLWMDASYATAQYASDEWAARGWTALCASLRTMSGFYDFVVCALEQHIEQMKTRPPRETHAPRKSATKQKLGTTNPAHQCEPAAVAAEAQPLAAGGEQAARDAAAPAAYVQNEPNSESASAGHDHSKSKIATTAPLMQARRGRKPGKESMDLKKTFMELLVEMTSSFKPVRTREVYASFRKRLGQDTQSLSSVPLRKIVLSVCNNVKGIEYFLQSESQPIETYKTTTPFASEMIEKFVLAGNVPILGKMVYYYTNSKPKNYRRTKDGCGEKDRRRPESNGDSDEEDDDAGGEDDIDCAEQNGETYCGGENNVKNGDGHSVDLAINGKMADKIGQQDDSRNQDDFCYHSIVCTHGSIGFLQAQVSPDHNSRDDQDMEHFWRRQLPDVSTAVYGAENGGGEGSAVSDGRYIHETGNTRCIGDEIIQQASDDAVEGGDGVGADHVIETWMSHAIIGLGTIQVPLPGEARPNLVDCQLLDSNARQVFCASNQSSSFNSNAQSGTSVLASMDSYSEIHRLSPNPDSNDSGLLGALAPPPDKMDLCALMSESSSPWNQNASSLSILAQAAWIIHPNQAAPIRSAEGGTEVSPPSSQHYGYSEMALLEEEAGSNQPIIQMPMSMQVEGQESHGPAHNKQETDLQRAAHKLDTCLVEIDELNSPCGSKPGRICPNCRAPACPYCATITDVVRDATIYFLGEDAEWEELHCLNCQNLDFHTNHILRCVAKVQKAISISISTERFDNDKKNRSKSKELWYHAGLLFVDSLPFSGVPAPSDFRDKIMEMVRFEMTKRCKPSVSPWDGEVNGFPPELILAMAQSFSCFAKVGEEIGPLRPIDEFPIIIYVSSDLGDHPSAHLWSAELMEMETSREAQVWVLCLANEKRLKDLDSGNSPFRGALKKSYGDRFLS